MYQCLYQFGVPGYTVWFGWFSGVLPLSPGRPFKQSRESLTSRTRRKRPGQSKKAMECCCQTSVNPFRTSNSGCVVQATRSPWTAFEKLAHVLREDRL